MTKNELKDLADAIARGQRVHWHDIYLLARHLADTAPEVKPTPEKGKVDP